MSKFCGCVLFVLVSATACENQVADPGPDSKLSEIDLGPLVPQQEAENRSETVNYFKGLSACADLEQHIEDRAVLQMKVSLEWARKWAIESLQWRNQPYYGSSVDAGSASGGGSAAPSNFTNTNLQHQGVDEPDMMKNDGTRAFVISGRKLFAATTWPATALKTQSSLALSGRAIEMFLAENRVVVFSSILETAFGLPSWCQSSAQSCSDWYSNATVVTLVDVSDLTSMKIVGTRIVPGSYISARRIGHDIRLVTTSSMPLLDSLATYLPWEEQMKLSTASEISRRFHALAQSNETKIRAQSLAQWIPSSTWKANAESSVESLNCSQLAVPNVSARLGLTNVSTFNIENPTQFKRQGMLAAVDAVYMNENSLYLSQSHWWWNATDNNAQRTYLYRFDVSTPTAAEFVSSGRIEGHPLNQFSFDEFENVLRVATTVTDYKTWQTVNRVVTLKTIENRLVELGRTEDLAPRERIKSARFVGPKAYVVTFRQVDPLYVIDLSTPANPRKVGELKIPGFSSYIHSIDDTHLLTIGTGTGGWRSDVTLQLFDVSDAAHPKQTHVIQVGTQASSWSNSEAQNNHKAFNYFAANKTLAIPFSDWQQGPDGSWTFSSDLRVYTVDVQQGFTSKGAINMTDLLRNDSCGNSSYWYCWYWEPQVRRSIMADNMVYAISSAGIRVASIDTLTSPIQTAPFEAAP
jgi:hypothetical protein